MYNLHLTSEQQEFRDTVRDFVEREIKPVILHPDRLQDFNRPFPIELIDQASQMGLRSLALSEELGGAGADNLTSCIVAEELAAGDIGIAITLGETSRLAHLLFNQMMTTGQCERLLPDFIADDRYHLAFAAHTTDPERGWQYHRPLTDTPVSPVTAVKQDNGDWIVNGKTGFVQNATIAKLIAVQAQAGNNIVNLLIPGGAAGLTVTEPTADAESVKWYHGTGGELTLANCRVLAANVLDNDNGSGSAAVLDGIAAGRGSPQVQAMNIGIARAAFEAGLTYAKIRVQGARPIIQHQAIGNILADVAIKIEVARHMVWNVAWASDHPDTYADRSLSAMPLQTIAKVFTSETMYAATEESTECFGAMGVMLDMPLAKYMHDARVFMHWGDSNNVAKLRIAEAVAGFERTVPVPVKSA